MKKDNLEHWGRRHKIKWFFVKFSTTVMGIKWDPDYSNSFDSFAKIGILYTIIFVVLLGVIIIMIMSCFAS